MRQISPRPRPHYGVALVRTLLAIAPAVALLEVLRRMPGAADAAWLAAALLLIAPMLAPFFCFIVARPWVGERRGPATRGGGRP